MTLRGPAVHLLLVGTELLVLPRPGVVSPPSQWGRRQIAIDAFHHVVCASATSAAYAFLDRSDER